MEQQWQDFSEKVNTRWDASLKEAIFSNPQSKSQAVSKRKVRPVLLKGELCFQVSAYEGKQVKHENFEAKELTKKALAWMQKEFKQLEIHNEDSTLICLTNKKGTLTMKVKKNVTASEKNKAQAAPGKIAAGEKETQAACAGIDLEKFAHNRKKKYLLPDNSPVPFLVDLGVQTKEGKIVNASYDKFKQINRFLEFVEDILPALEGEERIRILDFGCGKSYLTFAIYHYLHEICGKDVEITGLDLKADVIANCNKLAVKYGYHNLKFEVGDIKDYDAYQDVDLVVTLHACDTATDYALYKAIRWNAKAILSVPCCHHEVNRQVKSAELEPMLEYGIVKDRFAALATDSLRCMILKKYGYETQLLEFIDMAHTPKNLLIRAIKKQGLVSAGKQGKLQAQEEEFSRFLGIHMTLQTLLENGKE